MGFTSGEKLFKDSSLEKCIHFWLVFIAISGFSSWEYCISWRICRIAVSKSAELDAQIVWAKSSSRPVRRFIRIISSNISSRETLISTGKCSLLKDAINLTLKLLTRMSKSRGFTFCFFFIVASLVIESFELKNIYNKIFLVTVYSLVCDLTTLIEESKFYWITVTNRFIRFDNLYGS